MCVRVHVSAILAPLGENKGCSREQTFTPTERGRQVSVWKGEHVGQRVRVSVRADKRERRRERAACPPGRLSSGMAFSAKLSFLPSIRRELSLYFCPNHLRRKPRENVALQVSQRRLGSVSPRTNIPIAIIFCHL